MKNEDVELIQRVLAGDDTAFSVLVRKYQKQVHALAWRKIGDFHIAEEITQDTFLKVYKKLTTLKNPQRFEGWLYVITANGCSSWLRKNRLRTQSIDPLKETYNEQLQKATYSGYIAAENERVTLEMQRDVIKKLLAKLPESERTVITLHYFGEMSCREIGAFLGVSANTIKSRLRRAQQHLKEEIPMIKEALDNFKIAPNLTENIVQKTAASTLHPSGSKPFTPWIMAVCTGAAVLLMLGIGNHQYLTRFQKPYSFDAASEMKVELIEASLVLDLVSKLDARTHVGSPNSLDKKNTPAQHLHDNPDLYAKTQTNKPVKDYAQWQLPKAAKARLGKGGINALQFSPDGMKLAVGTDIGIWLYDLETGKEISLFAGTCKTLTFSPDGRFLINGGGPYRAAEIQIWETTTGHSVPLAAPPSVASALQFASDGKTLISLSRWGDTLRWLDIETGTVKVKNLEEPQFDSGVHTPEVYALTHDKVAVGTQDGKIHLWDTASDKKGVPLSGHADVSIPPLDAPVPRPQQFTPYPRNWVFALAFSPDGVRLASGGQDNIVRLWDTTGDDGPTVLQKHRGSINVLAFSPDGKMLASGSTDKTVQLWNVATGEPTSTLTGHLNGIIALAFSPDATTLSSASMDGTILFWDTETGGPLPTRITDHTDFIKAVTLSEDGSTLTSVAFNGIITSWDVETSKKSTIQATGHQDWFTTLAFSPDGTKLAGVCGETEVIPGFTSFFHANPRIGLTDVSTGNEIATHIMDHRNPLGLTFSPDGKTVAFGTFGKIRLWHAETGDTFDILLLNPNDVDKNPPHAHGNDKLPLPLGMMLPQTPQISALVFSPDGTKLISATIAGDIQMWDAETGMELVSFAKHSPEDVEHEVNEVFGGIGTTVLTTHQDPVSVLALSPNGELLAGGSYKQIRVWNMETGNWRNGIIAIDSYENDKEIFYDSNTLAFSPDSKILLNGDGNGKIQLWHMPTGDRHSTLDGHTDGVETLEFSADGQVLVSAGKDGTILLWDWDEIRTDSP